MEKANLNIKSEEEKLKNISFLDINGTKISFELLESVKYKNVEVIPIKSDSFGSKDFLTLKKGYEMGLVEIKELENATVNTVLCKNDAVVPLLLIDSDEITGAMQNRIINDSLLVPAQTSLKIPVSCTEHGRWHYKRDYQENESFKPSLYTAHNSGRERKLRASYENRDYQGDVWDSISIFEDRNEYRSATSALNDSYENTKEKQNDYLKYFEIKDGQNGAIFIVNGEFKGLELFYNPSIYREYHEKICRSYIIEAIVGENDETDFIDRKEIMSILDNISDAEFKSVKSVGLGENLKFSNNKGVGSGLVYENEIIHMSYLKESNNNIHVYEDFDDILI